LPGLGIAYQRDRVLLPPARMPFWARTYFSWVRGGGLSLAPRAPTVDSRNH
jgi:hypothetical protein